MSIFGRRELPPRYYQPQPQGWWFYEKTVTTNGTNTSPEGTTDEQIRRIVRQEIAELPIPFDVPDHPPESDA